MLATSSITKNVFLIPTTYHLLPAAYYLLFSQHRISHHQRLRHGESFLSEHAPQLHHIHRRLAFKVIVGYYERHLRLAGDGFNFVFPLLQLWLGIQIVIAFVRLLMLKPLVVVAA